MKIGIVTPGGVDPSGEVRVIPAFLSLIERLARDNDVHVFALYQTPRPEAYDLLGARVHCIGMGRSRLRAVWSILEEHRRRRFDVLHGFWLSHAGMVAAVAGGLAGVPSLIHVAGGELAALPDIQYGNELRLRHRLVNRLAMSLADCLTAASTPILDLIGANGFHGIRVPLGVGLDRWPPATERHRGVGAERRVLAVGSINRVKGFDTLVRAAAALPAPVTVDIVGEDTLDGEIGRLAEALGISESVNFHGFVRHSEVRGFMDRADLLVVSSRHEAGPVVALEAAVAGLPVVGTGVGHLYDWRDPGVEVVAPGDWQALARAIQDALADRERSEASARSVRDWAVHFDADWTAAEFMRLYRLL